MLLDLGSGEERIKDDVIALDIRPLRNIDIIAEGRDIGTVVFTDTKYKFYLDASVEERALRRLNVIVEEVEEFYRKTTVTNDLIELRNIASVAKLILQCAMSRRESRGLHYMTDYPKRDDKFWKHDTLISIPVS